MNPMMVGEKKKTALILPSPPGEGIVVPAAGQSERLEFALVQGFKARNFFRRSLILTSPEEKESLFPRLVNLSALHLRVVQGFKARIFRGILLPEGEECSERFGRALSSRALPMPLHPLQTPRSLLK